MFVESGEEFCFILLYQSKKDTDRYSSGLLTASWDVDTESESEMPKHVACLISLIVNTLSYINNAGKISTLIEQRGHTATQKEKNTRKPKHCCPSSNLMSV